jgi:hypothetical protein
MFIGRALAPSDLILRRAADDNRRAPMGGNGNTEFTDLYNQSGRSNRMS